MSLDPVRQTMEVPRSLWVLFLLIGVVLIVLGLFGIVAPFIVGLATVLLYGILILISGGAHAVAVFQARSWNGVVLHLLMAVLALMLGFFFLTEPATTMKVLVLVLTMFFIVGGIFRILASVMIRSRNWLMYLLSGVVSLLLGFFVWERWPDDSDWVIGTFIGIELLFEGFSTISLALAIRGKQ
jgi:uncharacterized membrane protein HdeD (DUF308 family)